MKIEVLGCSGNVSRYHRTTAYLMNDRVLFDAGSVTDVLAPERLNPISSVFLSHIHLDHVKGLCCLAEDLSMDEDRSVTLFADKTVLDAVSQYVFNGHLWPDFREIPDQKNPILRTHAMDPMDFTVVHDLKVKAIPVSHRIYTTGFLVKEGEKTVMFTSDTGMTERFWETAQKEEHIDFIIAHVAFPDRLPGLARIAGHMTPAVLIERIETYGLQHVPFYVAHAKTMFEEEIRSEIRAAGRENLRMLEQGSILSA